MKRFSYLLLAVLLLSSCQRDNFYEELGKPSAPEKVTLASDGAEIFAQVSFRGGVPGKKGDLCDALKIRSSAVLSDEQVLESAMVVIVDDILTEEGNTPTDSLIEAAYHIGVIIAVVFPDYERISSWCSRKGIVFPGVPQEAEQDDRLLLCAFSNRGWLYDMDNPLFRMDPADRIDYNAWLNPFVAWVNDHLASPSEPYLIGSGAELVFERNLACQKYDHTWFLALSDTVKVLSQMTGRFTSWPVTGADHDWFLCHAELDVNNVPMFCGTGVSQSNGIRTKFRAYEMRQAGFRFDMAAGLQGPDGFVRGPFPQSAGAGEPFSPDFDWTLDDADMLTEGPVTAFRSSALTAFSPFRHFGASFGNFPDLSVANRSGDGIVDYLFTVPSSLLGYMHRTEIIPSEAQVCRQGRDDLQASWVWRCARSDGERVIRFGVSTVYTSMEFSSVTVGAGHWTDHSDAVGDPVRKFRLLSPGRTLTGQLQLVNDFDDGASCISPRFWAEGKDPKKDTPDYDALWSDIGPGECFARNMETGRYLMQFYKQFPDGGTWLREVQVDISAAQPTVVSASSTITR